MKARFQWNGKMLAWNVNMVRPKRVTLYGRWSSRDLKQLLILPSLIVLSPHQALKRVIAENHSLHCVLG